VTRWIEMRCRGDEKPENLHSCHTRHLVTYILSRRTRHSRKRCCRSKEREPCTTHQLQRNSTRTTRGIFFFDLQQIRSTRGNKKALLCTSIEARSQSATQEKGPWRAKRKRCRVFTGVSAVWNGSIVAAYSGRGAVVCCALCYRREGFRRSFFPFSGEKEC